MASGSGVNVSEEVKKAYESIYTTRKGSKKYRYATVKFNDTNTGLEVDEHEEEKEGVKSFEEVVGSLPSNDVRYVFYDFPFITNADAKSSKVLCISWHPQTAPIKKRMLVSSTFSAVKHTLKIDSSNCLEGDDPNDLPVADAVSKCNGKAAA